MNILITGASRGLGAQLALQLASEQHRLILLARTEADLKFTADRCNEIAGSEIAFPLVFDLKELLTGNHDLSARIRSVTATLDTLVNNAGLLINESFERFKPEMSKRIFEANYFAPEQLIRLCLPMLRESVSPSIVNVTSMGAVQGSVKFPGLSVYSASKGALAILTECLAEEFKQDGIRVNALAIGAVQTEMLEKAFPDIRVTTSPEEMAQFFKWFITAGYLRFNGKMLPVSDSTP